MPDFSATGLNDCALAFNRDDGKFLFISANINCVLGYPVIDFYDNPALLYDIIVPNDRDRVKVAADRLPDGGWIELNYRVITAEGQIKEVFDKKSLIVDPHSGNKVLLSVINDNQAEKQTGYEGAKLREKFLNSLIDSQTNFLIRFNNKGQFTFANKRFLNTLGYKEHELVGQHFSVVTIPEEIELCKEAFYKCVGNPGNVVQLAHKKRAKDGSIYDTEWEFTAITNDDGIVSDVQGIGHDITHKTSIEREVTTTAQKLENFIESITDSFFILDKDWKFVRVNAAFEKVCNRHRSEIIGAVIWYTFPKLLSTGFDLAYHRAMSENVMVQFSEYFEPLQMWFSTTVYPSAEGLTVFVKDITDEKRAREELVWTKNSLEALINNTEDQIWSVDGETRYVYMNKAYRSQIARITGFEPQEGNYSYRHTGYSDETIKIWDVYYKRALAGERYHIISESIDLITSEILSFEISFNPIYKTSEAITGVGCFGRNITERLKTEKAIVDQNERLRNIASLSSHELRRPVASLLGLLNLMDRGDFFNPENKEIIEHLLTVGQEIDDVIRLIVDNSFTSDASPGKYQQP